MRLLPRFSLRFAMLALTIFLIGVGVVVKYWRAYQEHERVASHLESLQIQVEEEPTTLYGWVIGKRIIGLQGQIVRDLDQITAALREIPDKSAIRRVSCQCYFFDAVPFQNYDDPAIQQQAQELLQTIGEFSSLEVLTLTMPKLRTGLLHELSRLQKLRWLRIYCLEYPPGEMRGFLEKLPELEVLEIHYYRGSNVTPQEILNTRIPTVRRLFLEFEGQEIDFRLTDPDRYPNLESLVFYNVKIKQFALAPTVLPRLKLLDITGAESNCAIDWAQLPAAAPELKALILHCGQVTNESIGILAQYASLEQLHVAGLLGLDLIQLRDNWHRDAAKYDFDAVLYRNLVELARRCPQFKYYQWPAFLFKEFSESEPQSDWPAWYATQDRLRPGSQGGFF